MFFIVVILVATVVMVLAIDSSIQLYTTSTTASDSTTATPLNRFPAIAKSATSAKYRKVEEYSGSDFFNGFTTFTGPDPTKGYVDYVSLSTAAEQNLTAFVFRPETQTSNALVGVDYQQFSTTSTVGRKSVRLLSKSTFDVGLLTVVDVVHAPTGPGVWPAVWFLANVTGAVWPMDGEMDIMEWVNDETANAMTLHTAPGCVVERDPDAYLGRMENPDCNAGDGSEGCSIRAPAFVETDGGRRISTAGSMFNAQGGGVYVHEWTETGVTEWLFPRNDLPQDLVKEQPDPSTWTAKPLARWTGPGCQFNQAFKQQQLIINICLCGDWAGEVWTSSGMARRTGVATCDAYVARHPQAFREAYFEFASIKIYSSSPRPADIADQAKTKRGDSALQRYGSTHHLHLHHHRQQDRLDAGAKDTFRSWTNVTSTSAARSLLPLPSANSTPSPSRSSASAILLTDWRIRLFLLLTMAWL